MKKSRKQEGGRGTRWRALRDSMIDSGFSVDSILSTICKSYDWCRASKNDKRKWIHETIKLRKNSARKKNRGGVANLRRMEPSINEVLQQHVSQGSFIDLTWEAPDVSRPNLHVVVITFALLCRSRKFGEEYKGTKAPLFLSRSQTMRTQQTKPMQPEQSPKRCSKTQIMEITPPIWKRSTTQSTAS